MFRVFISYAPEDVYKLADILKWLEPLRQKYFLHIWYNRHNRYDTPNITQRPTELHSANLYLFLTSHHSIAESTIQGEEVGVALARQGQIGDKFVRIRPILLSPSHWKDNSRLLLFEKNALPPKKELSKFNPIEDGFVEMMAALQQDIEEMRPYLIEDAKLRGQSTDGFFREHLLPKATAQGKRHWRIEKAKEMAWVFLLLFLIWSLYQLGCEGKRVENGYVPPIKNRQIDDL